MTGTKKKTVGRKERLGIYNVHRAIQKDRGLYLEILLSALARPSNYSERLELRVDGKIGNCLFFQNRR